MGENQFRDMLRKKGFSAPEVKDYEAYADGQLHTHEFDVMLLVRNGPFVLATEAGDTTFDAGQVCTLAAGVRHIERTGPAGARVLLSKRMPENDASPITENR